jgi:hypothetical protein
VSGAGVCIARIAHSTKQILVHSAYSALAAGCRRRSGMTCQLMEQTISSLPGGLSQSPHKRVRQPCCSCHS